MTPFLPNSNMQFAWDSTSLGWLKTCPRLYQYHMIEGWRRKGESVHLLFGQVYHGALETYDKTRVNGADPEEATRAAIRYALAETWINGAPWESDHNLKTRETLVRSVIWYLDQFGEADTAKTVILASNKPAVELSFKMEVRAPYVLCGHMDRLVEYAGDVYVMDRKTSSTTISSHYFNQYSPDNQMSLYSLAAQIIYKTPVKGVIIDAAQIAVGFTRFSRGFTHRTEAQLNEWLDNTYRWFDIANGYARADFWPMNDKACHHYGGCPFRGVCSKSPEVREKFIESDFERRAWNPLEPR